MVNYFRSLVAVITAVTLSACILPIKSASTTPQLKIVKKRNYICLRAAKGNEYFSPSAVIVAAYSEDGLATVWQRGRSLAERAEVSPYRCVTARMSNTVLKPGVAYRASLKEEHENGKEVSADFCVIGSAGAHRIHQIRRDKKTGIGDWSPCYLKGAATN